MEKKTVEKAKPKPKASKKPAKRKYKSRAKNIVMDKVLMNKLIAAFDKRAKIQGYRGKTYVQLQAEFILGAASVIDILNKVTVSAVSPALLVSILSGNRMHKITK